jgi:sulfotransferase family protein
VIVWLASFPRSGNTMLRLLLYMVYGRRSGSLYDEPPWDGGKPTITGVVGSFGQVTEGDLDAVRYRSEPYFVKTHDLPRDDSPALCLIRDGRDALVSYARFVLTYEPAMAQGRAFHEVLRILTESRDHFGGWSGNVRAWCARADGGRSIWLRYEDLLREPALLASAMRGLGVELQPTGDAATDFASLHRQWPDFFRRGTPGTWRDEMTEELHERFWLHHHEPMGWFGYLRSGELAPRMTETPASPGPAHGQASRP